MSRLTTFPSEGNLEQAFTFSPQFMRPSKVPYAVMLQGVLSGEECDEIQETLTLADAYTVPHCDAVTREFVAAPCLDVIEQIARNVNDWYFNYDLDPGQHSWLQTYKKGDKYQRHMDGSPGQTRKLTAVAILSDNLDYDGGNLTLHVSPKSFPLSRTRGSIVVFQHWVPHDVSPVTDGLRQTVNMGFWGPPFK